MLVDPLGHRFVQGPDMAPMSDGHLVSNIVEVGVPCEVYFHSIGNVRASDFVTVEYYNANASKNDAFDFLRLLPKRELIFIKDYEVRSEIKFQLLALFLDIGILFSIAWTNNATYGVLRITSHHNGHVVPVGNNVVISGKSSSNSTNYCTVSVAVNGIKPYQHAITSGDNGINDYSNWTFTTTAKYTLTKQGINKISAKYSRPQNMNLTKTNSVNVIGVLASAAGKHQALADTTATDNGFALLLPGH